MIRFTEEGRFVYLPIAGINKMSELFRRLMIKYFLEKYLDNPGDSKQLSAETPECPVAEKGQKSTWARLIGLVLNYKFYYTQALPE